MMYFDNLNDQELDQKDTVFANKVFKFHENCQTFPIFMVSLYSEHARSKKKILPIKSKFTSFLNKLIMF